MDHTEAAKYNPTLAERWTNAGTPAKVAVTGGGVALGLYGAYRLYRWATKPDPITDIGPQCSEFALGSRTEVDAALVPIVEAHARRGPVNPFEVASEFIRRYAPECRSFPAEPRNPEEGRLFLVAFDETLRVLQEHSLTTDAQLKYFESMVLVWAQGVGLPAG